MRGGAISPLVTQLVMDNHHASFIVKHDIDDDVHRVTLFTHSGYVLGVTHPPDNGLFEVPQYDENFEVVTVVTFLSFN